MNEHSRVLLKITWSPFAFLLRETPSASSNEPEPYWTIGQVEVRLPEAKIFNMTGIKSCTCSRIYIKITIALRLGSDKISMYILRLHREWRYSGVRYPIDVKSAGFRSELKPSRVSNHTEELWYNETVYLWMKKYIVDWALCWGNSGCHIHENAKHFSWIELSGSW